MKPKLSIVKIGGNVIENKTELAKFLTSFSMMEEPKILVHGGGKFVFCYRPVRSLRFRTPQ